MLYPRHQLPRSFTLVSERSRKRAEEKLGGTLDYPTETANFKARE